MPSDPPLHANAGGQLAPDQIVGRDAVLAEILEALERRSVVLTGERRTGKTSVTVLLDARAASWKVVRLTVEGVKTEEELAGRVGPLLLHIGSGTAAKAARTVTGSIETIKLPGGTFRLSDPDLDRIVAAAVKRCDARLLLVLDELPIFVRKADAARPGSGTDVLHTLRGFREQHRLRMLLLGSIGFHHVIKDDTGVLNDTERIQLPPLSAGEAHALALRLLYGDGLVDEPTEAEAAATEIATVSEGVPYYIHGIVEAATKRPGRPPLRADEVDSLVVSKLRDGDWNMRHFRARLPTYYGGDAALAEAILDCIAANDELGLTPDEILSALDLNATHAPVDRRRLREVIVSLRDDHYLERDQAEIHRFASALVRRGWMETGR